MIISQPVDAIDGNDIGEALIIQGYGIDNRFGKDDGRASFYRLAVDDPGTGTGKIQMADAVFRVDVSAVKVDDCSVLVIDREDNAVVEGLVAFLVEDAKVFQSLDDFRIIRQDVFQAAVNKAGAEVGERLVVCNTPVLEVIQAPSDLP